MTDAEAMDLREKLAAHYGQPVMPVSDYCDALQTWFDIRARGLSADAGYEQLRMLTDLRKSALLGRLIYGGEKLREVKCPQHDGRWSGLEFGPHGNSPGNVCPHGCGLTGWLP